MNTINVWSRASEVPADTHDAYKDSRRPIFHPLAPRGWSSDPCGPILYKGRYHLFYQHQHASCQWYWGLCWDHVVSDDLVRWKNLPPAVVPTPGGLDADGCFSGTVEFDPELGVPVILYTGVYLKANGEAVAAHGLPPHQHDPGTRFVEKQLAAVPADPDDPDLTYWVKLPSPVMSLPPAGLNISCWRDPFCLQRPAAAGGAGDEWAVLLASGIRGVGGAVLRFRSKHFTHGWRFDGILADGDNAALGIRGQDWECPILAQLPTVSRADATAATAAAATAAKCPASLSLSLSAKAQQGSLASSSSSSSGSVASQVAPCTPARSLNATGVLPAKSTSLSSFSGLGGSSTNLAAVDDSASISSSSNAASASPVGTSPATLTPVAAAAAAAAAAIGATAGSMLALPLTEPALAAATSAAEAAAGSTDDVTLMSHPAVSVDVWVEHQTQQQTEMVAAVAADDVISAQDDITIIITTDDDASSTIKPSQQQHTKQQQQQVLVVDALSVASSADLTSSVSNGGCGSNGSKSWWFCMSPDACNNPITWWVGRYDGNRFDIAAADGPHRLDLGTTLYAATLWEDPQGCQLLYGWIQEHRRVPTPPALCDDFSYAGCISTPRVISLVDGLLWQTPLPDINNLRTSVSWHAKDLLLSPSGGLLPLQVVSSTHLDINMTLLPPAATNAATAAATAATAEDARAGLVFKSWRAGGKGAAVLSFNWASGDLLFDFDEPFPDAYNPHPEDTPDRRRVGGRLRSYRAGDPLSLRVLLDGSAVEVFTNTGETLTTRMYRGHPPKCACTGCSTPTALTTAVDAAAAAAESAVTVEDEAGIALFAAGAAVTVVELDVWEMGSCWVPPTPPPPQPPLLLQQQQCVAAAAAHHSPPLAAMAAVAVPAAGSSEAVEEAAVHGRPQSSTPPAAAAAAAVPAADVSVAAMAAVSEGRGELEQQQQHLPAGDKALVTEEFLEELHINGGGTTVGSGTSTASSGSVV